VDNYAKGHAFIEREEEGGMAQQPHVDKWEPKTIRLRASTIRELERIAGERKPDRLYPWKFQDLVTEALKEYLPRFKRHK
jgi:hypothetical protein